MLLKASYIRGQVGGKNGKVPKGVEPAAAAAGAWPEAGRRVRAETWGRIARCAERGARRCRPKRKRRATTRRWPTQRRRCATAARPGGGGGLHRCSATACGPCCSYYRIATRWPPRGGARRAHAARTPTFKNAALIDVGRARVSRCGRPLMPPRTRQMKRCRSIRSSLR